MQTTDSTFDENDYVNKLRASLDGRSAALDSKLTPSIDQSANGYAIPGQGESSGAGPRPLPMNEGTNSFSDVGGGPGDEGEQTGEPADPQQPAMKPNSLDGQPAGLESGGGAPKLAFTSKVDKAKTVGQVIDAAKPASLNNYMRWWEQQHGNINDKWDQVQQQIGAKPDPDRLMSRKEKFAALMDFGINLIKASQGRGEDTAGTFATAIGATAEGLTAKRKQQEGEWEGKNAAIQQGRLAEQKQLGTYGDAMKDQASIDASTAREAMYNREKSDESTESFTDDKGNVMYRMKSGKTVPATIDGKPVHQSADQISSRGGDTTYRQQHADLVSMFKHQGLTDADANDHATEAMHKPAKGLDRVDLNNKAFNHAKALLGSQLDWNPKEHKGKSYADALSEAADGEYQKLLGLTDQGSPTIDASQPPTSLLKAGRIRTMQDGTKWTLDVNGKPKRVK